MSDYQIPDPEPTEQDEKLAAEFIEIKKSTALRGKPEGDQRCDNCHFYVQPDADISYCWHDKLEIMVGDSWWCDRWEEIGASEEQPTDEDRATNRDLTFKLVEDQQWVNEPKFGEQCNTCLFYLDTDETVSYCWHPNLRVGVGFDHWCQWYEALPDA